MNKYFLTMFTIEGHTRWRAHMSGKKEQFETEVKGWGSKGPKLTAKVVYEIDRLTGKIAQI